jgi:hypothetical protein
LESNIAKFGFTPDKLFNVDESGFSTVQKRPQEIVAAVLLPADTAQLSSSETQNPETWAQSLTQKTVTTVAKMKITNHLVRE